MFVDFIKDAKNHIGVNYHTNLTKRNIFFYLELSPYCILLLAIITYMGLNNRTPYKLSNIYEIYREILLNNHKLSNMKSM